MIYNEVGWVCHSLPRLVVLGSQHHEEQQNTNLEETSLNNISVDHSGQKYETPRIAPNKKEALNNEGQVERMVTTFESLSECSLGNYPKL